jgi:hypothetical protein
MAESAERRLRSVATNRAEGELGEANPAKREQRAKGKKQGVQISELKLYEN